MSLRDYQNGSRAGRVPGTLLLFLTPSALFGIWLVVYGFELGFSELRYGLDGRETLGSIRPTHGVGPFASLGGYEFVVDGKTYSGLQQKMLREQPTVQYLSTDPSTNRVKIGFVAGIHWVISLLSIFGGALVALITITQIYVFFRFRKD